MVYDTVATVLCDPEEFRASALVYLHREHGRRAGHAPEKLKVGVYALGWVTSPRRRNRRLTIFPELRRNRYAHRKGTRLAHSNHPRPIRGLRGKHGALLVGNPEEVAEKILRHGEALGGISRITFQMDVAEYSQAKLLRFIELLGTEVAPALREKS